MGKREFSGPAQVAFDKLVPIPVIGVPIRSSTRPALLAHGESSLSTRKREGGNRRQPRELGVTSWRNRKRLLTAALTEFIDSALRIPDETVYSNFWHPRLTPLVCSVTQTLLFVTQHLLDSVYLLGNKETRGDNTMRKRARDQRTSQRKRNRPTCHFLASVTVSRS